MAVKEVSGGMLVIYSWGISCEFCWKCYTSENCFGKCCCQFIFLACIYFCLYMTKLNMNYCSKFHIFLQKIDVMNAILFTLMFLFDKKKSKENLVTESSVATHCWKKLFRYEVALNRTDIVMTYDLFEHWYNSQLDQNRATTSQRQGNIKPTKGITSYDVY